jgi:hypothetical protein
MHLGAPGRSRLPKTLRLQLNYLGRDTRCIKLFRYLKMNQFLMYGWYETFFKLFSN